MPTFEPSARRPLALLVLCALGALPIAPRAGAQVTLAATPATRPEAAAMRAIVEQRTLSLMRWPRLDDVAPDLRGAYEATGWTPLWIRDGRPTPAAAVMLGQLAAADGRGLRAGDYDVPELVRLAGLSFRTPEEVAAFDVAVSASTARFVRSLRFGRVTASAAHAELRFPREPLDVVTTVRELAASPEQAAVLDALEPPFEHYRLLKAALVRYQALARDTTLGGVRMAATLKPGARDRAVPRLRRLLDALGDLKAAPLPAAASIADSMHYDGAIVEAVRHFQARQGFEGDGVLGAATRTRLERPFDARIEQMAITLERWRWLPHVFADPPVIVNVPAFRLHAFSSSSDREADLLSMDVVVGDAFDHRTPVFSDTLHYVVFSPYWEVPPSIALGELLPKARRDRGYLERAHYEIVDNGDRILPPTAAALSAVAAGRARFRQLPGNTNSLGRAKFIFPNEHNIYFHDTPSQAPFGRARRDASHGCIRLSDPARLARFLLRSKAGWDSTRIAAAMARVTPMQVDLPRPVPVHIVYATAVAREDGRVFFFDDIYGHDRTLARLLAAGYPYTR